MNHKKISLIILTSLILLVILNAIILKSYDYYIYESFSKMLNPLVEKYPEIEISTMDNLLNSNDSTNNVLNKYGIDQNTIKEISSYKELRIKIAIITSSIYLIILSLSVLVYCKFALKNKSEITSINNYLQDILRGTYDLNIADYNEKGLSVLKNDIYKVAIKLKELSEYERNEQTFLMNTLEDISHQLKTPLTALMVTNDILKNNDLTKEERENFLNKEAKELEKMEWLITTLLKYSKLNSGSVKLKKENVNVEETINSILDTLSIALELKEVEINLSDLDFNIICDKNWTKEALTNIIKNAIEHLDTEGYLEIKGEDNPLYQAIIIKDNGQGIKKEDIKNIFKRFYTTNASKNSVGIGLNIAKLIFERQNAKIEVESVPNEFTTFKIIFPKKNC